MEREPPITLEPGVHGRRRVGGYVVEDDAELLIQEDPVELPEEGQKVGTGVAAVRLPCRVHRPHGRDLLLRHAAADRY